MKKIMSILLMSVLVAVCVPISAFATEEQQSKSTAVSYTVESGYVISIPASVSLNNESYIDIGASNVSIDSGRHLYVAVDKTNTEFYQERLVLHNGAAELHCNLSVGDISGTGGQKLLTETEFVVATFGSGDMSPRQYGRLYISPAESSPAAGTYTGSIYFTIYTY